MKDVLVPIIIAVIGSNALFGFIQFLISRKDSNNNVTKEIKEAIKEVKDKLSFIDQGLVRMQLLVLISNYPDRTEEIMKLAEQYFCKFKGNFYLTSLFMQYLDDNKLIYPRWFIDYKGKD